MTTEEKVMNYLKDVKEVLDEKSIPFWLEDGTLLGAVRDGRMIPWDHDMDLGSFEDSFKSEELRKEITEKLSKKRFSVFFFPNSVAMYKDDFHIDIILLKKAENNKDYIVNRFLSQNAVSHLLVKLHKLSRASFYGKPRLKSVAGTRDLIKTNFFFLVHSLPHFFRDSLYGISRNLLSKYEKAKYYTLQTPAKHFKSLKNIKYGGNIVNIPNTVEEYLEKKYGDWKTPPKDHTKWKWYEVGEWPKVESKLERKKVKGL